MKQVFSSLILIMLCVGLLAFTIKIQPVRDAATIVVPDNYATIQAAVNARARADRRCHRAERGI